MYRKVLILVAAISLMATSAQAMFADKAERLYKQGEKYLETGDSARAFLTFREVVRTNPLSEYADDAHFLIAHYYIQNKNYFQAENELVILMKNYPDSPYVEDAKAYFSKMRSRSLEDKVSDSIEKGDYKTAKIFLDEILSIDPNNGFARNKLAEVETILIKMDRERQELEQEKTRIEEESEAIRKARAEVSQLHEEALKTMKKAEKLNDQTVSTYESKLTEADKKLSLLEDKIEKLTSELNEWRDKAKKLEAQAMAGNGHKITYGDSTAQGNATILFEGIQDDPDPGRKEQVASELIEEESPTVVLLSETENQLTSVMKVELVLSLDLNTEWPDRHYLKFRIDYEPIAGASTQRPTIIYYTTADMDEIDTESSVYKKKIIVAVDKKRVSGYTVSAYFIEKQ